MEDQGNVFEAPKAPLESPMDQVKVHLYSPNQIAAGALLGGPLSGVYLLWSNFKRLSKPSAANLTLALGVVFLISVVTVLPFLPQSFPNYAIPLAYTLVAKLIANELQMRKADIAASTHYAFESNWRVVAIALIGLVFFLIVVLAILVAVLNIKGS